MANNTFEKNQKILYNSIPDQKLIHANQLNISSWNDIINILKVQANINTDYLERLHKWLIGNFDSTKSFTENSINIPVDELVFGEYSPSFTEYVLGEIQYMINNITHVTQEIKVNTLNAGTVINPTESSASVKGTGRRDNPLQFTFNIPRGFDGYGVHLFHINEQGELVVYHNQQDQVTDMYKIDPVTGNLYIEFEVE